MDKSRKKSFSQSLHASPLIIVGSVVILLIAVPALFLLSGVGHGIFSVGALLTALFAGQLVFLEMLDLTLFIMAVSSYLAMNFTGSTPFTSPIGVEKEIRKAIPAQAVGAFAAVVLWVSAGFMGS